jgi:hypothetical protein
MIVVASFMTIPKIWMIFIKTKLFAKIAERKEKEKMMRL